MSGLGGWWHYWRLGDDGRADPKGRIACGILAWKAELIYNGFGKNIKADLPFFGDAMNAQVKAFQKQAGAVPDGVLGPLTGRALAHKRKIDVGKEKGIPDDWLCHLITLESANDPVAEGWSDPQDEGYAQIHLPYHVNVTEQQAWSPEFAVPWAANYLLDAYAHVGKDWEGAVASYNQGQAGAQRWVLAGKPKFGSPYTGSDGTARDHFSDCYRYVTYVRQAYC